MICGAIIMTSLYLLFNENGREILLLKKFAMMFLFLTLGISAAFADTVPVITVSEMPSGAMWWHYSEAIPVRGTAPIKWSVIDGSLPSGLDLSEDGIISGTPQWKGTKYFTVQASNNAGYARKRLSIYISGALGGNSSSGGCNVSGFSFLLFAITAAFFKNRY